VLKVKEVSINDIVNLAYNHNRENMPTILETIKNMSVYNVPLSKAYEITKRVYEEIDLINSYL